MLTPVELKLFKLSYKHVKRQGQPSVDEESSCHYDNGAGLGCAASPFITSYDPDMEHKNFSSLVKRFPDCLVAEAKDNAEFVEALQAAHDYASSLTGEFIFNYVNFMRVILKAKGCSWGEVCNIIYELDKELFEEK